MILNIFIAYILLLLVVYFRVKDQISKRLIFVYLSYWSISLLLCKMNPFDYYNVSNETYVLLLLHLASFVVGYILYHPKKIKQYNFKKIWSAERIVKNPIFVVFYLFSLFFISVLFYRQRMIIASYTLSEIRGDFMEMILEGSGLAFLLYNIVGFEMFHFTLCLITYMLFFERNMKCILFLLPYPIIMALLSGGRNQVMTYAFYALSIWMISDYIQSVKNGYKSKYVFSLKTKLLLIVLGVGIVVTLSLVSFMKQSTGELNQDALNEGFDRLMADFGEYSAGPIVAFDIGRNDKGIMTKEYQYGAATFSGLDYFLFITLRRFGIHEETSYYKTTSTLQNDYRKIGPDRGWNYAYTSCMYYFYDLGV